jgi:hypothetical protein
MTLEELHHNPMEKKGHKRKGSSGRIELPTLTPLPTSITHDLKNQANLKHKKGHNSDKIVKKSSFSNLTKTFIIYTYIPNLASTSVFVHS